ncbi:UDP-N-acetylmuramoyl-tripeptide--D-alanyl-D-alanine ligase [Termitidicoccus mucosus]|uniref:UDP-N-acetylmuramoyl-tripeptide--D-alanyl-D- alanine ligase n=1 Tax=Termitidicoccus mucosus TaxID=1184151 RepID=UPI0031842882
MPTFNPAQLAAWTGGQWTAAPGRPLTGFSQDTRGLRDGDVFVALATGKRDGHDFLSAARAAGASAAIVARADASVALPQLVVADPLTAFQSIAREHRRAFPGTVVAISGSAGKTSTKDLLALLLGGAPAVLATEGNLNNHIGVPLTLTRLDAATRTHAVIEAGISAPGEMETLAAMIEPDHGIITLVAPAHTEELGGVESVAREKSVLLRHVRSGGVGVISAQCWGFKAFQDLSLPPLVVAPETESIAAPRIATYTATFTAGATELAIDRTRHFRFRRVTRGMAQNAALAVILAARLGVSDLQIQTALDAWRPAKWRGEIRRDARGRLLYLDCYNANPASFADALETFHALAPEQEPRLYVLGCMEELGPDADRHHRALGAALKLRAQDELFITGGHAGAVAEAAMGYGADASRIIIFDTKDRVIGRRDLAARCSSAAGVTH